MSPFYFSLENLVLCTRSETNGYAELINPCYELRVARYGSRVSGCELLIGNNHFFITSTRNQMPLTYAIIDY
jgi:hypothetical protein